MNYHSLSSSLIRQPISPNRNARRGCASVTLQMTDSSFPLSAFTPARGGRSREPGEQGKPKAASAHPGSPSSPGSPGLAGELEPYARECNIPNGSAPYQRLQHALQ